MIDIRQTDEFAKWLKHLKDVDARARINVRLKRISLTGNLGDTKPVGDGVHELRIDYGPGYRVYYSQHGREILLLLIGGDKSSQEKDIEKAKRLDAEYEQ
ncbi:type II toxin-antitoxin system RelE/ParE family toxin [Adlercreutzia sp. ZJ242]|uniref:type II toxin-antitoxin system RelE/ParE family toxin n=1 Tax=Adlercreutzia sp. ZJ242 TaxID=2709409 RepID=UPI0013EDD8F8|nr:type II toxin-antitoxin system RelE/ParE family toxin [Adlercreutzia sp. ZJ242]